MAPKLMPSVAEPQLALIAEPNIDALELYRTILAPRQYIVEHAITGPDALAKALANPPDVMIVETQLPMIDGYALCGLLRADPITRRVPIVVLASDAQPRDVERARRAGATTVLVQPCLPETLVDTLEQIRESGRLTVDTDHAAPAPPLISGATPRIESRRHQRYLTTAPPLTPPALRCPTCDAALEFEQSYVGGVSRKFSEQWDRYRCPAGCGVFQYRHRTRMLRIVPE